MLSHIWWLINPGVCLFFLLANAACSGAGTKGTVQEYITFPLLVQQQKKNPSANTMFLLILLLCCILLLLRCHIFQLPMVSVE